MTEVSDEFKIDILGYERDENNNLIEAASRIATQFGLRFEPDSDKDKGYGFYFVVQYQLV